MTFCSREREPRDVLDHLELLMGINKAQARDNTICKETCRSLGLKEGWGRIERSFIKFGQARELRLVEISNARNIWKIFSLDTMADFNNIIAVAILAPARRLSERVAASGSGADG
jgi:hypothetical protein